MKLSELKPCASCGGGLLADRAANWYTVRSSMVMLDPQAARETIGLNTMLGSLAIAEIMSPNAEAVMVLGERDKALYTEKQVCMKCYVTKSVAEIMEER